MFIENKLLRGRFNKIMKENGLKLVWVSEKTKLKNTSLSSWRNNGFEFGKDKLDIVESFVKRYED